MSSDAGLLWPLVLMAVGLGLMVLETIVPSGGLIGLLSLGCLGTSIYTAFAVSTNTGLWFLLAMGVLAPIAVMFGLHLWPKTPIGKRMTLRPPDDEDLGSEPVHGHRHDHLVGSLGRSLTTLRPSGMADFEGRRIDVLAEEGLIPAGALVEALGTRNGQLVVRPARAPEVDLGAEPVRSGPEDVEEREPFSI